MSQLSLDTPIEKVWGVGEAYVKRLKKLEIETVEDLLYHKPSRYEDWSLISPIAEIRAGEKVTVQGKVTAFKPLVTKNGKHIQIATITDQSSSIDVVWFNQRYLVTVIKVGEWFSLSGQAEKFNFQLSLVSPEFEKLRDNFSSQSATHGSQFKTIHTGRLIPVYPETYGLSSKWLRAKIYYLLEKVLPIEDWITENEVEPDVQRSEKMLSLSEALYQIHFPDSMKMTEKARERLAHDELLVLHLRNVKRKTNWKENKVAHILSVRPEMSLVEKFVNQLPFKLTQAQERAIDEILEDLKKSKPMNRLLEGDVGSGKTVVAAAVTFVAVKAGAQVAFMAPTEILAQQHFEVVKKLLNSKPTINDGGSEIKVVLQTGRKKFVKKGTDANFDVIIGTHALLTDIVNFDKLGLVIIDEQHRFGVEQRSKLINKGHAPHVLSMTATPIPRTVALTLYGDLNLSVLNEMPVGRKIIKTWLVPNEKREKAYEWIVKQLHQKTKKEKFEKFQAFVVCPFIEPSESMVTVKAAKEEFEKLQKIFVNLKLDLLHGKLKGKEKDAIIKKFRKGKIDILVSTPVVEVGVDIPNASIMVIETAERFGLAQLHQLRGRVGRGGQQAYCLLFTESNSEKTQKRLKAMEKINSGLELSELDLKLRGPGQIYGTSQHGFVDLKFANYNDAPLIQETKLLAQKLYSNLDKYPSLRNKLKKGTIRNVEPN